MARGARTPSSKSRSGSANRPTTAERLTPMPDYMRPITRASAKKFRKLHEDHMMGKLVNKRSAKKERNTKTRDQARELALKIPMELLAKEWFSSDEESAEIRAYLVDKIMPTLIMGVEKLLVEVDKKQLADKDEPDPNFNPINFLAQYLMRNNPKYSNFSEASPYVRGLRSVGEELRKQLFDLEENRLARIKSNARRKREEREHEQMLQNMERQRRTEALSKQFSEWEDKKSSQGIEPRISMALVQNALRSFADIADQLPDGIKKAAQFSQELEPTDDTGRTMGQKEFVLYISQFVDDLPSEVFDQIVRHLSSCASSHKSQADQEQRQLILEQLFKSCDHTGIGLIDRRRMLSLFEMFYDRAKPEVREDLRNPRKWPVVDVQEVDSYPDSDDEDEIKTQIKLIDNNVDKTEPLKGEKTDQDATDEKAGDETAEQIEKADAGVDEKADAEKAKDAEKSEEGEKAEDGAEKGDVEKTDAEKTAEVVNKKDVKQEEDAENEDKLVEGQEEPADDTSAAVPGDESAAAQEPHDNAEKTPQVKDATVGDDDVMADGAAVSEKEQVAADEKDKDTADDDDGAATTASAVARDAEEPELAKLTSAGKPPQTTQSKVSFAEGTSFQREKTLLTSAGGRSVSQASAYDETTLNCSQFIQVTESFLGDVPSMEVFQHLVRYLRDGYVETEDERMNRLLKARGDAQSAKRKAVLNSIFDMWDNEGSGFLDLDEVLYVMRKYKEGVDNYAIDAAKKDLKSRSEFHDNRLSKREFRNFVYKIIHEMGGGEHFDYFIEYLLSSIERSYQERVRGEARKKWLQQIITAGETSAAQLEPVYKAVFQSLYKDADSHGQGKVISAYVAMLERNDVAPSRGDFLLRYVAATLDHADKILNKALFKDMKGVSFAAVESGKPVHVPRVTSHGNIHFWDPDKPDEDNEGSFIVVPLKDRNKRVFGILGIDTLNDPHSRSIFITHEIQYFQGVAKAFSIAYHHVDVRQKTMRISESAISWIHRRSHSIHEITVYMVEPDGKGADYVLRRMMVTDEKGMAQVKTRPDKLERKDNLFRDYLFKCVDNSESVTADAYGERHLAIPLRDNEGRAIVVVDISIGDLKALPKAESKEVMRMLKLLQLAYKEISKDEKDKTSVLEGEQGVDEDTRTEILFDRLMLLELRENVSHLDAQAYAEMKSYKEPPPVVQQIIKAVLAIFYTDMAVAGDFDNWDKCKKYVNPSLSNKIMGFDPTASMADNVPVELINSYLDQVPHGTVSKHGSIPAQSLYNWVFVCVSLIEHTRKMRANKKQLVDDVAGATPDEETTNQKENIKAEDTMDSTA